MLTTILAVADEKSIVFHIAVHWVEAKMGFGLASKLSKVPASRDSDAKCFEMMFMGIDLQCRV